MVKGVALSVLNLASGERDGVIRRLIDLGLTNIHIDVMDGSFVPNKAIEIEELNRLRATFPELIFDVHLMVDDPESYLARIDSGVEYVTFHLESLDLPSLEALIRRWRGSFKLGVALRPTTPISSLLPLLPSLDLVLVMSVEPGFGGQSFLPETPERVRQLAQLRSQLALNYTIEVDGGIDRVSGRLVREVGADLLVCGTYLLRNQDKDTLRELSGSRGG